MSRITPVSHEESTGKTKELLDAVQKKLGFAPNMMKTMANSPAVLDAYLKFSDALSHGTLNGKIREQIALTAAEINNCGYCASAHTAIGKMVGLGDDAILAARQANSTDAKTDAALKFARSVVINRGQPDDADLEAVRAAGFTDGEIGEIVANVALNVFTNYFNETVKTDIDFPVVKIGTAATV